MVDSRHMILAVSVHGPTWHKAGSPDTMFTVRDAWSPYIAVSESMAVVQNMLY